MSFPFIRYGGNFVPRQPYNIEGVNGYGFAANGDQEKIQALVDKTLNFRKSDLVYRVISPTVVFSFLKLNTLRSAEAEDAQKGAYSETEFSVTILLAAGKHVAGLFIPERVVWYMPYLWLDSGTAMISGREIYGYPKQYGKVNMPLSDGDPAVFGVSTEVITHFAPNARSSIQPLIGVHRTDAAALEYANGFEAIEDAVEGFLSEVMHLNLAELAAGTFIEVLTLHHLLSLVFLRQLPDIADGSRASYQSIAEAPFEVTQFRGAGFLSGQYAIDINSHDSAPIATELGFEPADGAQNARITPHLGFHLDFDFRLEAGSEIWVAR